MTVRRLFGTCHVVFDVYSIPSTKDHEHARQSANQRSGDVVFTSEMKVSVMREDFLSNKNNKTLFITKLSSLLQCDGQEVTLSEADADIDIVRIALKVNYIN